jgi:iron complex transport system substrate-binding protein
MEDLAMKGNFFNITDQAGREMRLSVNIQRIVSLTPGNTEIMYALGASDMLAGVTEYCDYPPEAKQKPRVGGFSTVEIDRITELKPDLVLAGLIHLKSVVSELEGLDYTVLVLDASNIDGLLQAIEILGRITGASNAAESLIASLRKRSLAITSKTENLPAKQRPKVYFLHEAETWKTFGAKTIGDALTDLAGGYNVGRDFGEYYPYPSMDDIVRSNPDIIIAEIGYGQNPNEPLQMARSEERLAGVTASIEGRIYGIDSDLVSRAGPRLVDGLEKLAGIIHPQLFNRDGNAEG